MKRRSASLNSKRRTEKGPLDLEWVPRRRKRSNYFEIVYLIELSISLLAMKFVLFDMVLFAFAENDEDWKSSELPHEISSLKIDI